MVSRDTAPMLAHSHPGQHLQAAPFAKHCLWVYFALVGLAALLQPRLLLALALLLR